MDWAIGCAPSPTKLISVVLPSQARRGAYRGHSCGIPSSAISCMLKKPAPLKPDGRVVAHYLSHHPAFRGIGIGPAKVARLRKTFGDDLVTLLDQGDAEKLSLVLDGECASNLIQRWGENAKEASVVAFLDAHYVDVRLASKVLRVLSASLRDGS